MKILRDLVLANKKYIIFDMDGTLIDSIGIWNTTDQHLIKILTGLEIDLDIVLEYMNEKRNKRDAFNKKIFLERVE